MRNFEGRVIYRGDLRSDRSSATLRVSSRGYPRWCLSRSWRPVLNGYRNPQNVLPLPLTPFGHGRQRSDPASRSPAHAGGTAGRCPGRQGHTPRRPRTALPPRTRAPQSPQLSRLPLAIGGPRPEEAMVPNQREASSPATSAPQMVFQSRAAGAAEGAFGKPWREVTRDGPAAASPAGPGSVSGSASVPARHGGAAAGPAGAALRSGRRRKRVLLGAAHGAAVRLRLLLQRAALGALPHPVPAGAVQKLL